MRRLAARACGEAVSGRPRRRHQTLSKQLLRLIAVLCNFCILLELIAAHTQVTQDAERWSDSDTRGHQAGVLRCVKLLRCDGVLRCEAATAAGQGVP